MSALQIVAAGVVSGLAFFAFLLAAFAGWRVAHWTHARLARGRSDAAVAQRMIDGSRM